MIIKLKSCVETRVFLFGKLNNSKSIPFSFEYSIDDLILLVYSGKDSDWTKGSYIDFIWDKFFHIAILD